MAQEVALLTEWRERLKRQSESGLTIDGNGLANAFNFGRADAFSSVSTLL